MLAPAIYSSQIDVHISIHLYTHTHKHRKLIEFRLTLFILTPYLNLHLALQPAWSERASVLYFITMYLTLLIRVLNEDNLNMTEICHCKHFLVWCIRSKSGIGKVKRQAYSTPSINHRHINLGIERDNRKWSENMATRKMFAKAWNYLKAISKEKEDEGKKTYKSTTKHQRLHKRRHRKCHEHAKNRNIIIIFLYSNKRFEEEEEEEEVNEKNMYKYDQSLKGVARKKERNQYGFGYIYKCFGGFHCVHGIALHGSSINIFGYLCGLWAKEVKTTPTKKRLLLVSYGTTKKTALTSVNTA